MNFFKKLSKLKLLWGVCALVFAGALLSCVVDDKDDDDNKTELSSVSISGTAEIEADKSSTLTAAPKFTNDSGDSSSVIYKWEITGGSEYATLSESTENTVTITGKNETIVMNMCFSRRRNFGNCFWKAGKICKRKLKWP